MRSKQETVNSILLCALLFGLALLVGAHPREPLVSYATPTAPTVLSYEILPSSEGETIVRYTYPSVPITEKLAPDEEVALRTVNSYTRILGYQNNQRVLQTIVYEKEPFVRIGSEWHYRDSATTTLAAFYGAHPALAIKDRLIAVARAASYSGFSTSGDGWYEMSLTGDVDSSTTIDFGNCVNALDYSGFPVAPSFKNAGTLAEVRAQYRSNLLGTCSISRGYLTFNTSSIPAGSTISAATLQVYVTAKDNLVNDGNDAVIVTQPNAIWTAWSGSGSNALDITSITTSAYNTFTLNSGGYAMLTLGGTSVLGLQEGHDTISSMVTSTTQGNSITYSTSEETGTAQDPTLSITYTEPPVNRTIYLRGNVYLRGVWLY